MIACLEGFKEKAEYLLQNGAMVNKSCNNGCTALHYACTKHHRNTLGLIKMLINYNATIDALNSDGKTPLLNASLLCDEESCAYLIECNPKEVYHVDKKGFTSLHYACFSGKSILVDMLLSFNVNLNTRSRNGITPLYMACVQNHKDIAMNLLKHGAVNYLEHEDRNCLHAAVLDENKELVKILLKYEANVDIQDSGGRTALHVASMKGTFEIVKLLVLHNATINLQNNRGDTPLHFACKGGHDKIVEFLFLQKALLKLNDDNASPLHHTCRNGNKVLSEILISQGANINQRTKKGVTPLHEACNQKQPDLVQLLIQNHSEINHGDNKGIAPLHIACWRGNTGIITELIQQGVHIDNQTIDGESALLLACSEDMLQQYNFSYDTTQTQIYLIKGFDANVCCVFLRGYCHSTYLS
ncbi:unnamed protein product [Mytilus edulis]|uniref:Uncharacterized protein n=1 Tax=Mytilus edulis TaxID=6550 RepID=A0A8S3TW02_MYTED|nr:unnamed protein product [Mytilus edulis]